jgi:hypothetical protein
MPPRDQQETDHDLLIRIDTKMEGIGEAVLKIEQHLAAKADAADVQVLEKRIAELEQIVRLQGTALTAATAAANSSVKTVGSVIGWLSGAVTIGHYLLVK